MSERQGRRRAARAGRTVNGAFEVLGSPPRLPVVAHVPHSGVAIPPSVRHGLALDDAALDDEHRRVTDHHTDDLFAPVLDAGGLMFVNRLSRLVVDPERFRSDEDEVMASRGVGAVYRRTSDGGTLRADGVWERERDGLLAAYYDPYTKALGNLVQETLDRFGSCLIIDCHSYPLRPLGWELDPDPTHRPPIGLGTDPFHTPERLVAALEARCREHGIVAQRDRPFRGAYVPASYLRRDGRVRSVMVEVRRDLYLDDGTHRRSPRFGRVRDTVAALVEAAIEAAQGTADELPPQIRST